MGRTIKNQNTRRPKPVEKIQLSEKHIHLRVFLVILLLAVAAVSFTYALTSYLKEETGWKVIKVSSAAKANVGDEFTFQYELGGGETSATAEYKALTILYSDAAVKAYEIFSADESFEDVVNLYELNQHPGEVLTVEEPLYQALELLETYGNRNLYLGPVYEEMYNLFQCKEDYETASFDPEQNEVLREEFAVIADFAADPEAVDLKLLGENQVCLEVSEEYQSWTQEHGYETYLDFYWMKNAFLVDYLAEVMLENGYTRGVISSYDGFYRNLDERDVSYSFHIFDRVGQDIYPAAVMEYNGPESLVYLRNYPISTQDQAHYYEMKSGEIRTAYIDGADGLQRTSRNDLVAYSSEKGCAEVLLTMIPVYVSASFDASALEQWKADGIYSIYCEDRVIHYNEEKLTLKQLYQKDDLVYTAALVG